MRDVLDVIAAQRTESAPSRHGRDASSIRVGMLLSQPDADGQCEVSVLGSPAIALPAAPSTYVGVTTVHVLMDSETGRPLMVLAPAGTISASDPVPPPPPPPLAPTTQLVSGRVVAPTVSGTWRASRAAWDRWNAPSDVYQAGSSTSGTLSGIACYGDQIVNLGASKIERAQLVLISSGNALVPSWVANVAGSPHGSLPASAPSFLGTAATPVTVPGYGSDGARAIVDLSAAMREDLRTGASRALGLTSTGTYGGTRGVRDSQSWVLVLDYMVTT